MLVTGGAGFIGAALARSLLRDGHEMTTLDDGSRGSLALARELESEVDVMSGDVRDPEIVRRACSGREVVIHLAAVQGTATFYRDPERVLEVNLAGTLNVARACGEAGARRLVFASSSEVYGPRPPIPTPEDAPLVLEDPRNPRFSYAASKIAGESIVINAARQRGFEHTVLRYHNVYGPRMGYDHVIPQFIRRLVRGEEFTVEGDGTQTRAFCYIDDAVDGTQRAAVDTRGADEIFNIGDPSQERPLLDVIALLEEISGRSVTPRFVAAPAGSPARRCPDIERASRLLGFEPAVGLREGLARTYAWYAEDLRA